MEKIKKGLISKIVLLIIVIIMFLCSDVAYSLSNIRYDKANLRVPLANKNNRLFEGIEKIGKIGILDSNRNLSSNLNLEQDLYQKVTKSPVFDAFVTMTREHVQRIKELGDDEKTAREEADLLFSAQIEDAVNMLRERGYSEEVLLQHGIIGMKYGSDNQYSYTIPGVSKLTELAVAYIPNSDVKAFEGVIYNMILATQGTGVAEYWLTKHAILLGKLSDAQIFMAFIRAENRLKSELDDFIRQTDPQVFQAIKQRNFSHRDSTGVISLSWSRLLDTLYTPEHLSEVTRLIRGKWSFQDSRSLLQLYAFLGELSNEQDAKPYMEFITKDIFQSATLYNILDELVLTLKAFSGNATDKDKQALEQLHKEQKAYIRKTIETIIPLTLQSGISSHQILELVFVQLVPELKGPIAHIFPIHEFYQFLMNPDIGYSLQDIINVSRDIDVTNLRRAGVKLGDIIEALFNKGEASERIFHITFSQLFNFDPHVLAGIQKMLRAEDISEDIKQVFEHKGQWHTFAKWIEERNSNIEERLDRSLSRKGIELVNNLYGQGAPMIISIPTYDEQTIIALSEVPWWIDWSPYVSQPFEAVNLREKLYSSGEAYRRFRIEYENAVIFITSYPITDVFFGNRHVLAFDTIIIAKSATVSNDVKKLMESSVATVDRSLNDKIFPSSLIWFGDKHHGLGEYSYSFGRKITHEVDGLLKNIAEEGADPGILAGELRTNIPFENMLTHQYELLLPQEVSRIIGNKPIAITEIHDEERQEFSGAPGIVSTGNLDIIGRPADNIIAAFTTGTFTLPIIIQEGKVMITEQTILKIYGREITITVDNIQEGFGRVSPKGNTIYINMAAINDFLKQKEVIDQNLARAVSERIIIHEITEAFALQIGHNPAEAHFAGMMAEAMYSSENSQEVTNILHDELKIRDIHQAEQLTGKQMLIYTIPRHRTSASFDL